MKLFETSDYDIISDYVDKGTAKKKAKGLTREEIAAMKEYLQEKNSKVDGTVAVLAAIAKMKEPDRSMAKKVHEIITSSAPELSPRTWYGMPAYTRGDKVICFFQNAGKFKARYSTIGFTDKANLDEGKMWPTTFALSELTNAEEAKIRALIKKAIG
ncbi:MAG: DUF1801 domain-containing protein [Patescibacteria group bacterium]|nr:DUF1801 domain-containing protein [Patescibacteria group bacterium]MDE1846625.1 DUF1801 domain-containing protein [Candidatus Micrarchaeota archaeon]MDE2016065.1 DUF1801 domain-containing protein [Patescibacteria group bacterium]